MAVSESVLDEVRAIIADVQCLEVAEVLPESRFETDLEGESIGLIELSFRFEKQYGIKFRFPKIEPEIIELDGERRLTPGSMTRLKAEFPYLHVELLEGRAVEKALDLLTVAGIAGFVEHTLEAAEAPAR